VGEGQSDVRARLAIEAEDDEGRAGEETRAKLPRQGGQARGSGLDAAAARRACPARTPEASRPGEAPYTRYQRSSSTIATGPPNPPRAAAT
jgi:hypothetical protein